MRFYSKMMPSLSPQRTNAWDFMLATHPIPLLMIVIFVERPEYVVWRFTDEAACCRSDSSKVKPPPNLLVWWRTWATREHFKAMLMILNTNICLYS